MGRCQWQTTCAAAAFQLTSRCEPTPYSCRYSCPYPYAYAYAYPLLYLSSLSPLSTFHQSFVELCVNGEAQELRHTKLQPRPDWP
ncbi:hypothetical protein AWZ03_014996, partial [Drosophila navojoa]